MARTHLDPDSISGAQDEPSVASCSALTHSQDGEQTIDCCFKLPNFGIVLKQQ